MSAAENGSDVAANVLDIQEKIDREALLDHGRRLSNVQATLDRHTETLGGLASAVAKVHDDIRDLVAALGGK